MTTSRFEKCAKTLDFDTVLGMLSGFCQSEGGKAKAVSLVPNTNIEWCTTVTSETEEADRVLFEQVINPSFAVDDLTEILTLAQKGLSLSISDILKVGQGLGTARRIKAAINRAVNAPALQRYAAMLTVNQSLEDAIFAAFISDTEVSDNASQELKTIRGKIRRVNSAVKNKLSGYVNTPTYSKYLQDNIVTMRGDRYVIPIKSEFKGSIPGLIHDQSTSGATLYVEPMQIVEMNNELKTLLIEEKQEIDKIIRRFSSDIGDMASKMLATYETITELDLIFAKAEFGHSYRGIPAEYNEKGSIRIIGGRHPLIDKNTVVPISIWLGDEYDMLLVTGPNTGGKTVTLKLVGLFELMAMCGLFVPANECKLSVFDDIFCDIGDEQSIEQSLSTFSSHIKNIIGILDQINNKSLVLLDELGAGTDPSEGAALAVSISEFVLASGAKSVLTSHFNDLKEFALLNKRVGTASMDFDTETFAPTYRLIVGAVGSSNALHIAKRLGLSESIIANASSKLSREKKDFDNVILSAESTRRRAEQIVAEAEADREAARECRRIAEQDKNIIAQKREKLDDTIRKETKRLIADSMEEADAIIEQLREIVNQVEVTDADYFKALKLRKQLQNMAVNYDEESIVEEKASSDEPQRGDRVYVKSLSKVGVLMSVNPRGDAQVRFGNVAVKVKKGDFYKVATN